MKEKINEKSKLNLILQPKNPHVVLGSREAFWVNLAALGHVAIFGHEQI